MCGCNKKKIVGTSPAVVTRPAPFVARSAQRVAAAPAAVQLPTLDTSEWGPSLWKALHVASYCSNAGANMQWWGTLLNELQVGIPCPDCRAHYSAWYRSHPLRSASLIPIRKIVSVGQWVHDLHNDVNRRTGKPTWSYGDSLRANGRDQLDAAKAAAASLQGKISDKAYSTLMSLLNAC